VKLEKNKSLEEMISNFNGYFAKIPKGGNKIVINNCNRIQPGYVLIGNSNLGQYKG